MKGGEVQSLSKGVPCFRDTPHFVVLEFSYIFLNRDTAVIERQCGINTENTVRPSSLFTVTEP